MMYLVPFVPIYCKACVYWAASAERLKKASDAQHAGEQNAEILDCMQRDWCRECRQEGDLCHILNWPFRPPFVPMREPLSLSVEFLADARRNGVTSFSIAA
eukprot:SAG31_NODE_826_length_11751_cov_4.887659_11_plen_101_part_00